MAVPDSPDEHQFLWNMFTASGRGGNVWTGCNDKEVEGHWMQAGNGQECGYLGWAPGEPEVHEERNCVQMWAIEGGLLDDTECYHNKPVICEFPAVPSITCLQEYTENHFAVRCLTSRFSKDLPARISLLHDLVSQSQPQWRSIDLRLGDSGRKICKITATDDNVDHACVYFYI